MLRDHAYDRLKREWTPECRVHARAVSAPPEPRRASTVRAARGAARPDSRSAIPARTTSILVRDAESLLELLDPPVVVVLDHQRLAHISVSISHSIFRDSTPSTADTRQVSSRLRVSGIQIHISAASRNAAPVMVNATPKPRVAATEPIEYGAAALAMRPKL